MAPENPREGVNEYRPWKTDALCFRIIQSEPSLSNAWFEEDGSPPAEIAAKICFQCPVRLACLKEACDNKEPYGIWGGLPASTRHTRGMSHRYLKLVDLPSPHLDESDPNGQ